MIQKQIIDKTNFSIFLRDLSIDVNINLKHIIEDEIITNSNKHNHKNKHYHKNKKNNPKKKKDIIIEEQKKIRYHKNIEDDNSKIKYLFKNIDIENPFDVIQNLKTDEGIINYKFLLLDYFLKDKEKFIHYILLLYFELKDIDKIDNDQLILLKKIKKSLKKYDYKLFMMENLGHLLPPLNNFKKFNKFDQWQIDTINFIKNNESVIVRAPTSSGKTFIAMASGIFHKKILYVCPAKPVAYQVGANFIHMGYKVHFLLENSSHFSYDKQTNIFIGTPYEIENNLTNLNNDFDYVVFDEIHNINKEDDGDVYENIIKLMNCNFLALSATIKNVDFLKEIFTKNFLNKKINYIEYNKRFINHQKWIWNENKLIKLHPLCSFNKLTHDFVKNDLSFTPNDCANLWNTIENEFENDEEIIESFSPDEYFKEEKLLTLDDCSYY